MSNTHDVSFFGQSYAMLLSSPGWDVDNIFIRFIKKKSNDAWEKPSQNEGLAISLKILELIAIKEVLDGRDQSFKTVHGFGDRKTSIAIGWNKKGEFWVNVGKYKKILSNNEVLFLSKLFDHIINEKISMCARIPTPKKSD